MGDEHLVGYWPLRGDCNDASGKGNHGVNHGVDLAHSVFSGANAFVTVPPSESLRFGRGDFTVAAWISTDKAVHGVTGDIVCKYDPQKRSGFSFGVHSSAGGYSSRGDDQHLYFGIDEARVSDWESCGRPSPHSNYVSNSLTTFDGGLYAGTVDADKEEDWCHVFRYQDGQAWLDCGRVGNLRTHGVGPMIVHQGKLFAGTWNYDWTRVMHEQVDCCRVYYHAGGTEWVDCGQPGENRRLIGMASYQGQLYTAGDDRTGGTLKLFVYEGGMRWRNCAIIPTRRGFFPHAMGVYAGRLYIGTGSIHAWDGERIAYAGTPAGCTQVHSLEVHQGRLYAGTWPEGRVFRYDGGEGWEDCGRPGDSYEVNALAVYNGKLYAGSIPRAEVYRYEGGSAWTRMARFFSPDDWQPTLPSDPAPEGIKAWTRVTSLTVFKGQLFASIGSCTSAVLDAPCDVRGEVYRFEAGRCVSYDRDIGPAARHVAAVRAEGKLALYVDGARVAISSPQVGPAYDISNDEPLRIGSGEVSSFRGQMREVRMYDKPLNADEVNGLYNGLKAEMQS